MADIFISYAREDAGRVEPIVEELKKNGWSVFWDRNLRPGSSWAVEIGRELEQSRCVLVVWSLSSIDSEKHHWVREEAETGRERKKLVPLRLDNLVLPLGFKSILTADLSNWNKNSDDPEFQQLVAAIKEIIFSSQTSSLRCDPQSTSLQVSPAVPALEIGAEFGGGKVAFIDATGKHGLIAAEEDLPGGDTYTWNAAKKACSDFRENGYSDWFLPSTEELNQLYLNRRAVGGFSPDFYWSSTEGGADYAWNNNFDNGNQNGYSKHHEWRVRPVRAF